MTFLSKRSGRSRRWFGVMFVFAFAAASFGATPLFAHEKGVLTLNTRQAAPGDTLIARGSKLAKDASFRIEVRGVLRTFPYGRVRTDSTGKFEMRVPLPTDAKAGGNCGHGDISAVV